MLSRVLQRTQGLVFKSVLSSLYFQNHLTCSEATLPWIMLGFSSASCFTDGQLPADMVGLTDFPTSPPHPAFLLSFVRISVHGKFPLPTSACCPQERRWAWPLGFRDLYPLSLVYSLQPWNPLSCLTITAFHFHSLYSMVWGFLCLWVLLKLAGWFCKKVEISSLHFCIKTGGLHHVWKIFVF